MKPSRKCDCGEYMRCYVTQVVDGVRKQSWKCPKCKTRLQVGYQVIYQRIKRAGDKVFSQVSSIDITQAEKAD